MTGFQEEVKSTRIMKHRSVPWPLKTTESTQLPRINAGLPLVSAWCQTS
jgi:hypothetical protein